MSSVDIVFTFFKFTTTIHFSWIVARIHFSDVVTNTLRLSIWHSSGATKAHNQHTVSSTAGPLGSIKSECMTLHCDCVWESLQEERKPESKEWAVFGTHALLKQPALMRTSPLSRIPTLILLKGTALHSTIKVPLTLTMSTFGLEL